MQKNCFLFSFFITFLTICLFPVPSHSASIKDIQSQMTKRKPAITQLMNTGVVGENNKGYLEFRQAKTNEKTVLAENQNRSTIYKYIAKREGATPDFVGKKRAKVIAQKGAKGQWFQKQDGSWYKK